MRLIETETAAAGNDWTPLRVGLFGGSFDRLGQARAAVNELLQVGCDRLDRKGAPATSLCNSLRTTTPLEQASEIDRQPDDVRGCDNARHLRMVGVVTIGHQDPRQAGKNLSDLG